MKLFFVLLATAFAFGWLEFNTAALIVAVFTMAVSAALFAEAQRPGA